MERSAGERQARQRRVVGSRADDRSWSENASLAQNLTEPIAFEDLFALEHRRLFGALCLITRDPHEAEDIGQEAFVRVPERWDRVGSMVDPVGYLYRVAMNLRFIRVETIDSPSWVAWREIAVYPLHSD